MAKKTAKKNSWAIAAHKHRKILELLRAGVSIYEVSRVVGVGTKTVQRRKTIVDAEMIGEISEDDGEQAIAFRASRWRCPVHGLVEFSPCVICTSLAAIKPAGVDRGGMLGN